MNDQELQIKFQIFEQQIMQLQQQLQAVEQAILELNQLSVDLEELKGKTGKEILAQIGRGIFVKTNLISEELIVDVGDKNFIKKSISETKKIILEQVGKLGNSKEELNQELENLNKEITEVFLEHQKKAHSHEHNCECGKECEDKEGCECGHEH